MTKKYRHLLFDLDGTLTDPMEGITRSVQHALRHFGIEVSDLRELCPFIGPPFAESFRTFYGFDDRQTSEAVAVSREYFTEKGIFENRLYDGMDELLDTLTSNNATATFLFSEEQLSSLGDLLRRVVISGNAAALRIAASGGSSRTVSAIERANNALWAACNEKARLVALYGASDKTLRAVRAAGYCPIDFDLDYSGGLPTAAQAASSIARQARSGGCIAYLGADTAVQADWSTLLSRLRSSSRLITALNELAVTKDA